MPGFNFKNVSIAPQRSTGYRPSQPPRSIQNAPLLDSSTPGFERFQRSVFEPGDVSVRRPEELGFANQKMHDAFGVESAVAGDPDSRLNPQAIMGPMQGPVSPALAAATSERPQPRQPSFADALYEGPGGNSVGISSASEPESRGSQSFRNIELDLAPGKETWQTTPGGRLVDSRAREAKKAQEELDSSSDSASSWWSVLLAAMFPQYGQAISMMHGLKSQKFQRAMDKYNAAYGVATAEDEHDYTPVQGASGDIYTYDKIRGTTSLAAKGQERWTPNFTIGKAFNQDYTQSKDIPVDPPAPQKTNDITIWVSPDGKDRVPKFANEPSPGPYWKTLQEVEGAANRNSKEAAAPGQREQTTSGKDVAAGLEAATTSVFSDMGIPYFGEMPEASFEAGAAAMLKKNPKDMTPEERARGIAKIRAEISRRYNETIQMPSGRGNPIAVRGAGAGPQAAAPGNERKRVDAGTLRGPAR